MTVFLAWASAPVPVRVSGPWEELRLVSADLALITSPATLSAVYHELKWALPEGAALLVTPVTVVPKVKGLPAGTLTWLRDRII